MTQQSHRRHAGYALIDAEWLPEHPGWMSGLVPSSSPLALDSPPQDEAGAETR
jgi:hypothetical protein